MAGVLQSLVPALARKTRAWMESQRAEYFPRFWPLTATEHTALASYFAEECLSAAPLAKVERIPSPPFLGAVLRQLEFIGERVHFNFSGASGITFQECILIAVPEVGPDLLFHELVHVEQYRLLGVQAFARAYVQGVVDSGFVYDKIPLEAVALEMSNRCKAGERFVGSEELPGWLKLMNYSV
jgi:hypothetical protein